MTEISPLFQNALQAFGKLRDEKKPQADFIASARGRIPDTLLDFWVAYGWGIWLDSYFQLCDPARYRPILETILDGDPDFSASRSHVIGYSAFGSMLVWNEEHRGMDIDMRRVTCRAFFKGAAATKADTAIAIAVGNVNDTAYDPPDNAGKPLFKRVRSICGQLELGQIYGPKLDPALGGVIEAESFRRVSALEGMAIAAQIVPFTLFDSTKPSVPAVRRIGQGDGGPT